MTAKQQDGLIIFYVFLQGTPMKIKQITTSIVLGATALLTNVNGSQLTPYSLRETLLPREDALKEYTQQDFSNLLGMKGFSDKALQTHFKLYGGYVKNTNLLLKDLATMRNQGEMTGPYFAELKRRYGWEFNGMRLHELYFENLGKSEDLKHNSTLYGMIERDFGSFSAWEEDFRKTGAMRGIGWVILYLDPATNRLTNTWVNEHDVGHLVGATPLLVMDVWEHAYMVDYGINRGDYIDAFVYNINWNVVSDRFDKQNSKRESILGVNPES